MDDPKHERQWMNLGTRKARGPLPDANFPSADIYVHDGIQTAPRGPENVDVMLVNPPSPDGGIWIRSQHRVGRRSRENMIWPQVSLVQLAALLEPDYTFQVIDAIALHLNWKEFTGLLERYHPRYYITQVTAPTLDNDMYGAFLAKARGAQTIAFGTHVTPIPGETLKAYPALDFVAYGEPDLTIRDLIDHLDGKVDTRSAGTRELFEKQPGLCPRHYRWESRFHQDARHFLAAQRSGHR